MNFSSAIEKMIKRYGYDFFDNPFLAYSKISDEIKSSTYDNRLAGLFFKISKSLPIVELFCREGLDKGRKILEKKYSLYASDYSKREFVDAINSLCLIMFPKECQLRKGKNEEKAIINKKQIKVTNPVIHTNTQKKKNIKSQKLDTIQFTTKAYHFELKVTTGKNVEVVLNNQKTPIDIKSHMINTNTCSLFLGMDKWDSVVVSLPRMFAKNVILYGKDTLFEILGDHQRKIKEIENLSVESKNYSIIIDLYCDNLKAKSSDQILFNGLCKNANLETDKKIYFYLETGKLKHINLKMNSIKKKIYGRFLDGTVKPRIKNRIGFTKEIKTQSYVGTCEVNFDLQALKGTINVK